MRLRLLALIGLAKNVGKTTTTNHLLETLLGEKLYRAEELALTSLGLDGEGELAESAASEAAESTWSLIDSTAPPTKPSQTR